MMCEEARKRLPLLLYDELGFDEEEAVRKHVSDCEGCRMELDREKVLQEALAAAEEQAPPMLLAESRRAMFARVAELRARPDGVWRRLASGDILRWAPVSPWLQPFGVLALLACGYFGGHLYPMRGAGAVDSASIADPVNSRVRYLEPGAEGRVRIVIEETRDRTITGRLGDEPVRRLLIAAVRDRDDPGLRVESVNLLKGQLASADVREALLDVVQRDPNAGVRLKALEGLRSYSGDAATRRVMTHVLLSDSNPGVRGEAIGLLIEHKEDEMVGVLQDLMQIESNGYVRQRCRQALRGMRASPGTF